MKKRVGFYWVKDKDNDIETIIEICNDGWHQIMGSEVPVGVEGYRPLTDFTGWIRIPKPKFEE